MRRPDWRFRLDAYLASAWRRPFAYGHHDCAPEGLGLRSLLAAHLAFRV